MGDIHDTMNMLAEAEEDRNMDMIADMAPPPQGWNEPKEPHWNTPPPPPPPTPPPCRLSCSSCGYTASEPEFRKNHPYCKVGVIMWMVFGFAAIMMVGSIVMIFLRAFGLI